MAAMKGLELLKEVEKIRIVTDSQYVRKGVTEWIMCWKINGWQTANGEKVKLISTVGEVTATVKITDAVSEGMLFVPISFPETPVNELFDIILNSETKAPSLKACSVKIEKIASL